MKFTFKEGEKTLQMHDISRTFIHWYNEHKIKAVKYDSPAPWLGNAVGNHPTPHSFIQTYCETCKEKHGIKYLDRFNDLGITTEEEMTEDERRKEIDDFINT